MKEDKTDAVKPPKDKLPKGYFPVWLVECRNGVPVVYPTRARLQGGISVAEAHTVIDPHFNVRKTWTWGIGRMCQVQFLPHETVGLCSSEESASKMVEDYRSAAIVHHLEQVAKLKPLADKPPLTLADLTEEQAIQVAKMALGGRWKDDFCAKTSRGHTSTIGHPMFVEVTFYKVLYGLEVEFFHVIIHDSFDLVTVLVDNDRRRLVGSNNQRAIQKLFTEWGAE